MQLDTILTTRNAALPELVHLLREQRSASLDVVVDASAIGVHRGALHVGGIGTPTISDDGVTHEARLRLTATAEAGLATKLGIPLAYLRRARAEEIHIWDGNVAGWLALDERRFLLRTLLDSGSNTGIARAVLSSSYRRVDNLDVLVAVLDGIRQAGVEVEIGQCDLTERRMYVQVRCPAVAEYAPELLADYRSPFTGARGADNPTVFAGFVVSNSEVGLGRYSITPRLTVEVCTNGLTFSKDAIGKVHLGSELDEGVLEWSADTQEALSTLVVKQTRDAVTRFLDRAYVRSKIAELNRAAGVRIANPTEILGDIGKQLHFTATQQAAILEHFITGCDHTSGGILHAVTSAAQTLQDADDAYALEAAGLRAMHLAAAASR